MNASVTMLVLSLSGCNTFQNASIKLTCDEIPACSLSEASIDTDTDTGTSVDVLIDFDDASISYGCAGFGGGEDCAVEADPTDSTNNVLRVTKADGADLWAGATMFTDASSLGIDALNIAKGQTSFSMRVWSPRAGIPILLKVEDSSDSDRSVETLGTVTAGGSWETVIFDFANQTPGTEAVDYSWTYNKASIFPDFGTSGANGGGGSFYFDDFAEDF
jgi:hypothetical protein